MFKVHGIVLCALAVFASSVLAEDSKEEIAQAAKALSAKENYSWKTTVTVPQDAQFRPGPVEGKTEKGGATYLEMSLRDSTADVVIKDRKVAMKRGDDGWQSGSDLENEEGWVRFVVQRMRNFKTPAEQTEDLLKDLKDVKKEGDAYTGELTEEGAKNLMRFRRGGDGPEITHAKGSARFWTKDGVLSKLEYR